MELNEKTLLLMGGAAYASDIAAYKKEKNFKIVAVGRDANTDSARVADVFYNIDTQNVDDIVDLVEKEKIDGIFVGASEVNILPAIAVSERTKARFYADRNQWSVISDKEKFKQICREVGVPVVPEYDLPTDFTKDDLERIQFPILIKPVDSSGARGLYACYSSKEFEENYYKALEWSNRKKLIIEEFITDAQEVFFQYNIQNGEVSLSSSFVKVFTKSENNNLILPIFHMYSGKYLDVYYSHVHDSIVKLFNKLKIMNGYVTIQSFYKNGKFFVFEAGYRMGGAQNYIFTAYQNDVNALEYMVNYALTGNMYEQKIIEKDNAYFKYPCCNYYVGLKPGVIAQMNGIDEICKMQEVLNVTVMSRVGDEIRDTNALERVCLRIHVLAKNKDLLAKALVGICEKLHIVSNKSQDMLIEHLTYERCINAINECGL